MLDRADGLRSVPRALRGAREELERGPLGRHRVERLRRVFERERVFATALEEASSPVVRRAAAEASERPRRDQLVEGRERRGLVRAIGGQLGERQGRRARRAAGDAARREVEREMRLPRRERDTRHVGRDDGCLRPVGFHLDELCEVVEREGRADERDQIERERRVPLLWREARRALPGRDRTHTILRQVPEGGAEVAPCPRRGPRIAAVRPLRARS